MTDLETSVRLVMMKLDYKTLPSQEEVKHACEKYVEAFGDVNFGTLNRAVEARTQIEIKRR